MARNLTTGTPWRVIGAFAVPLLLGNVVQQLYQVTDAIVVGRTLGVDALAAVGATGSLVFLLMGFAAGMASGFAIPTAQAFGAGDADGVRRSVAAGSLLTGAASVLLTACAPLIAGPALRLLGTPAELLPQATTFAMVTFLGASATMFFNYLGAIIRAIGDSRTPLVFLLVTCLINVALVLAIVRWAGFGVGGAALATVISQALSVAMCLAYVRRRVPVLHVRRADWRVSRATLAEHLRIGLPMGFQMSIIAIGSLAVQLRLNSLGSEAVAAYTTAMRVDGIAIAVMSSLGLACSTFTAQNYGAGRLDRIRQGVVQSVVIAVGAAVVVGVVLTVAGSQIVALFVGPGEEGVVDKAAMFLRLNGSLYSVLAVLFVLRGALQALGRTLVPTVTGLVELGMRVTAAFVLGGAFGFAGVVWGNPLAWFGAVAILVPVYVRAHRSLRPSSPGRPITSPGGAGHDAGHDAGRAMRALEDADAVAAVVAPVAPAFDAAQAATEAPATLAVAGDLDTGQGR